MNPSPDRGKECLPPKKRESRQGSADQRLPLDEFKSPAPLRTRPASTGRGEGGREASDGLLTNPGLHFLPSPPPLPAPAPSAPLPLPWPLAFSPSVPLPYLQGQVGERRGSASPSWRDEHLPPPIPRWLREGPLTLPPPPSSSSSSSSFKSPYSADSREMWSYYNAGRRDYSSPLFSSSHLLSHGPLYPPDLSLAEGRHRYLGKRPNGLDGPGSRTASTSRALPTGEYSNDLSQARLDSGPHGSHANGRRRNQEDPAIRSHSGGPLFPDSLAQEGPDSHSSLQDRDPREAAKISSSPQSPGTDPQVGRAVLLDPLGGSPVEAHIYYSLGSVYPGLQPSHHTQAQAQAQSQSQAQAYPAYSPSGTPLYSMPREPGARLHSLRNSQHSPQGQLNSHGAQRDRERDREREQVQDRQRERDKEKNRERDREKDRDRERERERERQRGFSPGQYPHPPGPTPAPYPQPQPQPPTLLPHFAKGSLIELAGGRLKRVEELRTEDFLRSADTSPEFHLSTCTVLLITPGNAHGFNHLQVLLTDRDTQELLTVLVEYPFFVRDQGWSSCRPQRTLQLYGLPCRQLAEGDVCLALTPAPHPHRTHARTASRAQRTHPRPRTGPESNTSRDEMPPPPPPPPLPHQTPAHPLPPPPPPSTADRPVQEQPRPRKRRWSAPDLLPPSGMDKPPPDLPHSSKQRKRQ